ncbi:hypothetical protein PVAP13_6KG245700 [Panicum virgatum]|uniref:Uncharacterized protein n=1 Tax=Panicum virgatum TaxID=38727 RepID=A0A8T0RE74_PANVG|nr:hypothetical protein PVAP13_6KG245700 [Panicum virgatum]
MALPFPSHPAFASLAAACAVLVGVAFASVRGWIRPYGRTYAAGVVIGTLLGTNAFVLYTDDAPEARVKAAAERLLIDGEYAWPLLLVVAGCVLGCVVVSVFRACVEASGRRRRRMVPLVPGRSARAGRRATGCGWRTLVEPVLFFASVWACVYCIPGVAGGHIAAMPKGGDPAGAGIVCDHPRYESSLSDLIRF